MFCHFSDVERHDARVFHFIAVENANLLAVLMPQITEALIRFCCQGLDPPKLDWMHRHTSDSQRGEKKKEANRSQTVPQLCRLGNFSYATIATSICPAFLNGAIATPGHV